MMRGKQWIQLRIKVTGNVLDFTISNSKPVEPVHTKNKTGIGLENVKKRLALLYPGKYQLNIRNTETVYSVQMQIKM
jgi:LytS/YehU family sensor histidine kinase